MNQRPSEVDSPRNARSRWRGLAVRVVLAAAAAVMLVPGNATAGEAPGGVQPNIVGGHAASEPYPWMVSLQLNWKGDPDFHTCGGVLLFRDWVVTNAHCVTQEGTQIVPDLGWHVRVGSHNRTSGGETARVVQWAVNPEWAWGVGAPKKPVTDLVMGKIDRKLNLQTIELASTPAKPGDKVRLLGWGVTEPDGTGPLPTMLQEQDTKAVPASQCANGLISGGEICIANLYGTDGPCDGDSGSPVLKKEDGRWKLVGGASRETAKWCGTAPAIYTSSPEFRTWIYDTARGVPVPPPVRALPVPPKDSGYGLPFERPGGMS